MLIQLKQLPGIKQFVLGYHLKTIATMNYNLTNSFSMTGFYIGLEA